MNLKLAFRRLFKTPFVTVVAVLSLALGIGANAAIFSLFDQMLLRPLPVREPDRAGQPVGARAASRARKSCDQAGDCDVGLQLPDVPRPGEGADGRSPASRRTSAFGANLAYQGADAEAATGMLVSGSYFPVLGLAAGARPAARPERRSERSAATSSPCSATPTGRRGSAPIPNVLNQTLIVNGQRMTIVGVAPRGFNGTTLGTEPDVFVPITMRELMVPGWKGFDNRRSYWAYLFARLKPGVTIEQARAAMNGVYRPIVNDVEAPLQKGMSDQTMARFKAKTLVRRTRDGAGQSSVHDGGEDAAASCCSRSPASCC